MRTQLSPELLQKVKESINLIELVGEHVVLRKAGANHVGLCPFHSERSPSFSVSEIKQLYHCYGCKAGGDALTFVQQILGVGFHEAIEELADRGRVPLPADWHGVSGQSEAKDSAYREKSAQAFKLNRFAAAFFHQQVQDPTKPVGPRGASWAQDYLKRRTVGGSEFHNFYLGAAPDSWDALATHLSNQKAPLALAVELGLIRPSTQGKSQDRGLSPRPGYFDLFRNRILFPIVNLRGKVAGFGGRILSDESPKYLNSQESFIFQKNKLLFGLYQAQKYIREKEEVIIVEGYFDVLAMHAAGFKNVVATCGTSLTVEHLAILKRFCPKIVLLFDGDLAGIAATERAMEVGLDQGLVLYGAKMPPNRDPDELIFGQPGPEGLGYESSGGEMARILGGVTALLDFRIEEEMKASGQSSERKTQALKKIGKWLERFKDPIGRQVRLQLVQKQLGIAPRISPQISPQISKEKGEGRGHHPEVIRRLEGTKKVQKATSQLKELSTSDQILLSGVLSGGKIFQLFIQCKDRLPPGAHLADLFEYLPVHSWISTLLGDPEAQARLEKAPQTLIVEGIDSRIREVLTSTALKDWGESELENWGLVLSKAVARIWARFSQQIKAAISNAEMGKDIELQARLLKEYLDVQRKMKDFSSFI
jgi:DNA primase catalytic core